MTTNGLNLITGGENGYGDFASAMQQITNGNWSILFTNATTTNLYWFTVSAPNMTSNMLPATVINFPVAGSLILSNQTTFTWQGPLSWPVHGNAQVFGDSYYQSASLPAAQNNWMVDTGFPLGTNYSFYLQYITNNATPVFVATTPLSTNSVQTIPGWVSTSAIETGSSVGFSVFTPGAPTVGHANLAYYTFEDNNLFAHDFSGHGNNMLTYAWFSVPPYIVTNDAASGTYAAGFGGSGWLIPPTNLLSTLEGSFSVSLWLKTTNVYGNDSADEYSAAGIVSAVSGDIGHSVMPMGLAGHKLAFYTGGASQNILRSQANIDTGQYVHLVTTRDQRTGEKKIYVNGVLDASVYAADGLLTGSDPGGLAIGYNNANVFTGKMDEIQFYFGVLSSTEVAYLHNHPGTNVADTASQDVTLPIARFDFEQTNSPGIDSSGRQNNADCTSGNGGTNLDTFTTNSAVGTYAREYLGDTSLCFTPGNAAASSLSNAFYGDFSVTAWVKTTNSVNSDFANAYFGAPILFAYNNNTNDTVPLSITGSKAAITINDPAGAGTTLHSATSVNDGHYHLLAVTRNQTSGLLRIYVDGNLDGVTTGPTNHLTIPSTIYLAGGWYVNYIGLLDDVRIYGYELAATDVALLAGTPVNSLGSALDAAELAWLTSGDSHWFVETTNTHDNVSAAQSGVVTNLQTSILETSVVGPGTLTFWWQSAANGGNFDFEFDIDLGYANDISGIQPWTQDGPYALSAGSHTLTWTVRAGNDNDPTEAGYLDQVSFVASSPVALLNPQTVGSNFQFQFLSQAGFTHSILYRTNLVAGTWQTYSSIGGDGTLKTISVPFSVFSPSKQGFVRVTTE
jgi:hypothetical protein